jgi:hypothetical protein
LTTECLIVKLFILALAQATLIWEFRLIIPVEDVVKHTSTNMTAAIKSAIPIITPAAIPTMLPALVPPDSLAVVVGVSEVEVRV